ncbi:putative peroxiredoxin pmp20 [Echria macrotheca]|uniref:Thioredoxin peroxidase n=1 Tax=Echria macrotheca TaxID=438768 RepID=A0AAJ0BKQ6_9PEZI|nr:putative peroxiredoxin pmp20 [Echria macrotheca]
MSATESGLKAGDAFPEGVKFSYVPPTGDLNLQVCGLPTVYDASNEFKTKKVVLVAVPGAFTPTCSEKHLPGYIAKLPEFKEAGVQQVIFIASNDVFVMSAWAKVYGIKDDSILFMTDTDLAFSKSIGWVQGERTQRYAIIVDHGKVVYADRETVRGSLEKTGADAVLSKL